MTPSGAATAVCPKSRAAAESLPPAICARCGKETEVPFVPRNDKPVYCSECFAEIRGE